MALTVEHFRPADPAEAVEFDHFMRMLPALRERHPGDYDAVCGGELIARSEFSSRVDSEAQVRAAGRAVYVGFIDPHSYVIHIGGFDIIKVGE
jgi:hypothetical protein